MTMSLSLARPMVADPGGFCGVADPGRMAWIIFVARFPASGGLLAGGAISVCGWKLGYCAGAGATAPAMWVGGCQFGGGGWCGGYAGGRCAPALFGYIGCGGAGALYGGAPGCGRDGA